MITLRATCDECARYAEYKCERGMTKSYLLAHLRHNGWSFGKQHLCPVCTNKRRTAGRKAAQESAA